MFIIPLTMPQKQLRLEQYNPKYTCAAAPPQTSEKVKSLGTFGLKTSQFWSSLAPRHQRIEIVLTMCNRTAASAKGQTLGNSDKSNRIYVGLAKILVGTYPTGPSLAGPDRFRRACSISDILANWRAGILYVLSILCTLPIIHLHRSSEPPPFQNPRSDPFLDPSGPPFKQEGKIRLHQTEIFVSGFAKRGNFAQDNFLRY